MRLPGGPMLALRDRALAEAIAAEWQAAGVAADGTLRMEDIVLTRIAGTVQERIVPDPDAAAGALAAYAETDLLCYRAEGPAALAARQEEAWRPWLDWARDALGAALAVTVGVMPVRQPATAVAALREAVYGLGPAALGGLGIIVPATGSLVLSLAVARGILAPEEAHALCVLDEVFVAERWGEDAAALHRRNVIRRDIADAARFMALSIA